MKKRVMISSIYSSNTFNPLLVKLSPAHIILLVEENISNPKTEEEKLKKQSIEKLKQDFGETIKIEELKIKSLYDLYEIAKSVVQKIDSLEDAEVILNITEGRKTLSFGMYFAGYLRKEKVSGIYYLIKEGNKLLKMPLMNFEINSVQKNMLKKIEKKGMKINELKDKIDKSKSVFYKYLSELEESGYVVIDDTTISITETGRMLLL